MCQVYSDLLDTPVDWGFENKLPKLTLEPETNEEMQACRKFHVVELHNLHFMPYIYLDD